DGAGDGLLGGQRQDTLFSRVADAARAARGPHMSRDVNGTADFEHQLRTLLGESVQRVGGRARSRLNQARHAALAEAARGSRWRLARRTAAWLRLHLLWMPAGGAVAAAALVAFVLWPHAPQGYPAAEAS